MLITPEPETSSQNERPINKFQDASSSTAQLKTVTMNNNSNSEQNSSAPSRCYYGSDGGVQQKHNNAPRDKSDNNLPCVSGLACLKLQDKTSKSSPPPTTRQNRQIVNNPKLCHLNNFTARKSPRFVKRALFLNDADADDDNNEVFHQSESPVVNSFPGRINTELSPPPPTSSSSSSSPPRCSSLNLGNDLENKQLLISGRLYLIRQIGNASQSSGSPSSPSRSFTKPFSFSSIGLSSPNSSPPSQHSLNSKRKLPVYVRVYKCNKDHFALISRDSSYSSKHIYLNLRHCRVMPGNPLGRFIVAGNSDSGSLMEFETTDLGSLEGWLDALQTQTPPESPIRAGMSSNSGAGSNSKSGTCSSSGSPSLPKSPVLPTLTETDED